MKMHQLPFSFAMATIALGLAVYSPACSSDDSAGPDADASDEATVDGSVDAGPTYPAPHPQPPAIVSLGGPVATSPTIVPVFFQSDSASIESTLTDFLNKLATSKLWSDAVSQYGVALPTIAPPVILSQDPTTITTEQSLVGLVDTATSSAGDAGYAPRGVQTIYALYPTATPFQNADGLTMCQSEFGDHSSATTASGTLVYTIVPRCAVPGSLTTIQTLTAYTSHELIEAVTDPLFNVVAQRAFTVPSDPSWLATFNVGIGGLMEVADACEVSSAVYVQVPELGDQIAVRTWSSQAATSGGDPCVPSIDKTNYGAAPVFTDPVKMPAGDGVGYYDGGTAPLGIHVATGSQVDVTIDLFSNAPTGPIYVSAQDLPSLLKRPAELTFKLDRTSGINGDQLKMTVTRVGNGAPGGTPFIVFSSLDKTDPMQKAWMAWAANQ